MKEMKIEKTVDLHQQYEAVDQIHCDCKLDYVAEEKGIRAAGGIEVSGVGIFQEQTQTICEEIELDIFAPYEKIDQQSSFRVLLKDSSWTLRGNELDMVLDFIILGLEDEKIRDSILQNNQDHEAAAMEDLLDDQESIREVQHFAIAQRQDTYQTIAERYHVSEKELIAKNQNKPIEYKSLVLLPKESM